MGLLWDYNPKYILWSKKFEESCARGENPLLLLGNMGMRQRASHQAPGSRSLSSWIILSYPNSVFDL